MASMRDIKRRKDSISSTSQITKAMKLVATSKLQKAKQRAHATRPYFNHMYSTISSILGISEGISHPFLEKREGKKTAYILMTSNTGLAGGYNGNICKLVMAQDLDKANTKIIAVGKKGEDVFRREGYTILSAHNDMVDDPTYKLATTLAEEVFKLFLDGEVDQVYIGYTYFASTISQEAKLIKVLPLTRDDFEVDEEKEAMKSVMTFEPGEEEVLGRIIPQYISSMIYGALLESVASEHGARMTAMDSATKNANEMIDELSLQYNRARQASITQELTEIVSGAQSLK